MRCQFGSELLTRGWAGDVRAGWGKTTMQRMAWQSVLTSLVTGALLILGAAQSQAGDWGFRMVGDLGGAPKSFAKPFFDASKDGVQYSSRGLELGLAWKDWSAGVFLYTPNKGFLERGYQESACAVWPDGHQVCAPAGSVIHSGTRVQVVGVRLLGVKVGHYFTLARPAKWLRIGVPLAVGAAAYTGEATRETWTREIQHTAAGDIYYQRCSQSGQPGQCVPDKIHGEKVFSSGGPPYPIVSAGLGVKVHTASWAEFEVSLLAENPRLPVLSWGMTFRKHTK